MPAIAASIAASQISGRLQIAIADPSLAVLINDRGSYSGALENVIERAVISSAGPKPVVSCDFAQMRSERINDSDGSFVSLDQMERTYIRSTDQPFRPFPCM